MNTIPLPFLPNAVFRKLSDAEFEDYALKLFRFQYDNNPVYQEYCRLLSVNAMQVDSMTQIPFLPISFFKTHCVTTTSFTPAMRFSSSGTTGQMHSFHYVKDLELYETSFTKSFEYFYGKPENFTFLALLPNYLEREGSSLIYMMDSLIKQSKSLDSGFYLYDYQGLYNKLNLLKEKDEKVVLIGVTYALLDFVEQFQMNFPELIVFETGGMKGRRKEMVKEELHALLQKGFGVGRIHSEYGMCELLSQAYSRGNNLFQTPPWMKIVLRDEKNPLDTSKNIFSGCVNIIDLANFYSCAFIATDDLGRTNDHFQYEILGRMDHAEIRGCNLLILNNE